MGIRKKLNLLLQGQQAISERLDKIMALADDLKASIAKLDTETTTIGTVITNLAAKIKNSMTDQEVADVQSSFKALSDRLTSLGQDPLNPVPPPTPPAPVQAKKKP